ncbi:MAG: NUDIX domain-containing protein [Novosphingobium sp.]|nr:NUDIX domain-containing protein [Novosphingobium sp.]
MLHLIPTGLHRALYRIAFRVRGWFRRTFKIPIFGVSAVLRDEQGRVLLVRHSYGVAAWSLPGGGHGKNEDPADAVRRELREELSLEIEDLERLATINETLSSAPHSSVLFAGIAVGEPTPDGREVIAAEFFALDKLPVLLPQPTQIRLGIWQAALDHKKKASQSKES